MVAAATQLGHRQLSPPDSYVCQLSTCGAHGSLGVRLQAMYSASGVNGVAFR